MIDTKNVGALLACARKGIYARNNIKLSKIGEIIYPINSFSAIFKKELQKLQKLKEEPTLWNKVFDELKNSFKETIEGNDDIKLTIEPIPGAYSASNVDEDKYKTLCKKIGLPRVTFAHTKCFHEEGKE